jgi:hypothetical protein
MFRARYELRAALGVVRDDVHAAPRPAYWLAAPSPTGHATPVPPSPQ